LTLFGKVLVSWYIFPRFGTLCQEKSGNPAEQTYIFLRLWVSWGNKERFEAFSQTQKPKFFGS
jgi:hypothetical protein